MSTDTRDFSEGFAKREREPLGKGKEAVYDDLAHALRRKAMRDYDDNMQFIDRRRRDRREGGMGNNATFNGSTNTFIKVMLSFNLGLLTLAISGAAWFVYSMSGRMATDEASITALTKLVDLIISGHFKP